MNKDATVGLRLTQEELKQLDVHSQGQLSRAQIIRLLIQDFLQMSEEEQRQFLVKRLFEG